MTASVPAAPVKTEPTQLGVDVPVTTPAWLIKTAAVLVLAAGPFLNWWNPYHITSSTAKAAIVVVFTVVAGAIFVAQTGLAAVHKYGWTMTAVRAAYGADKDEVKALVTQLEPIAAQAQPVIAGITNHEPRIAALETQVTSFITEARQKWAATPDKQDLIDALKTVFDNAAGQQTPMADSTRGDATVAVTPAPAEAAGPAHGTDTRRRPAADAQQPMAAVTVYTAPPTTQWWTGVAGVPTINSDGTTFDASLLSAVTTAAAALGVPITINTPPDTSSQTMLTKGEADLLYVQIGAASDGGIIDGGDPTTTVTDVIIDGGSL